MGKTELVFIFYIFQMFERLYVNKTIIILYIITCSYQVTTYCLFDFNILDIDDGDTEMRILMARYPLKKLSVVCVGIETHCIITSSRIQTIVDEFTSTICEDNSSFKPTGTGTITA